MLYLAIPTLPVIAFDSDLPHDHRALWTCRRTATSDHVFVARMNLTECANPGLSHGDVANKCNKYCKLKEQQDYGTYCPDSNCLDTPDTSIECHIAGAIQSNCAYIGTSGQLLSYLNGGPAASQILPVRIEGGPEQAPMLTTPGEDQPDGPD